MRTLYFTALFATLTSFAAAITGCVRTADYAVVPLPREIIYDYSADGFVLSGEAMADPALAATIEMVEGYPAEGYSITVTADKILIEASDAAGAFYAVQTLRKSLPVGARKALLPAAKITDAPKMAWRGMHLDVSRHFFDVATVERYIDLLALHNLNRFHFHLTDDQGWRVEIKKYPRLTEIGSLGKDPDGASSNGFFTQDELRHIVEYAAERHITVVPEVDMPGHMVAALAAYPELGCTGGPYEITGQPGIMADILCAGADGVMPFLKDVFAELVEIFPSEYIHIGGDEAPRDRWQECPRCQAKIEELGLKKDDHFSAEAKLQSWMVAELGEFLASKGRKLIGWDEILEGGVPDGATVMVWRGWACPGAIVEAARGGHGVVMVPNSSLYFDYYQTRDHTGEPNAIGGYISLKKVYDTDIYPTELTPEERARIIGMQANLWTEYIATPEHLDYMVLPRMGALAEVAWSYPEPAERDFIAFLPRIARMSELYKSLGYNPCPHLFEVEIAAATDFDAQDIGVRLTSIEGAEIHYTLDGTTPTPRSALYTEPLQFTDDVSLRAVAFVNGFQSKMLSEEFSVNKATMRPIEARYPVDKRYAVQTLVDGRIGGSDFNSGSWCGIHRSPLDVTIDLGEGSDGRGVEFSRVALRTLTDYPAHVGEAQSITVSASGDGENFTQVAQIFPEQAALKNGKAMASHEVVFEPHTARWIEIVVAPYPEMPAEHPYSGMVHPFVFVDEVEVL